MHCATKAKEEKQLVLNLLNKRPWHIQITHLLLSLLLLLLLLILLYKFFVVPFVSQTTSMKPLTTGSLLTTLWYSVMAVQGKTMTQNSSANCQLKYI
jgi:hypothetical protein